MSEQSKPGPTPRVTDREILTVLRETDDPVLSTAEVADRLPIKRRATLTRLQRLAESGALARKQAGGRNTVWWLADEERLHIGERDPEEIMGELERFLDERDTSADEPVFDPSGADDDVYAREHVENLKQLTAERE